MVICLERGADLHMAQLLPLPLTVTCFCKIQIGFNFLIPVHPDSPGQSSVKQVCVCIWSAVGANCEWCDARSNVSQRGASAAEGGYAPRCGRSWSV